MYSYQNLIVWQKSIDLVTKLYNITIRFPDFELYGIVSQIRRAGISVPSNIAEGYARNSSKEYIRFLHIALGSLYELNTQLIICKNLSYINNQCFLAASKDAHEIEKMLNSLIKKIKDKS